jgi:hypothetical protein
MRTTFCSIQLSLETLRANKKEELCVRQKWLVGTPFIMQPGLDQKSTPISERRISWERSLFLPAKKSGFPEKFLSIL